MTTYNKRDAELAARLLRQEYLPSEFLSYMNDYQAMNQAPIPLSNIMGVSSAMVPIGVPVMWLRGTVPSGYVLLDGSTVSRTTYVLLYELWGTAFGAGDGSTTFGLPDFRGRVPVGKGTHTDVDTLGDNDGTAIGSRRMKHSHTVTDPGHSHAKTDPGHAHTVNYGSSAGGAADRSLAGQTHAGTYTTNSATTGITYASATTGITVGVATAPVDGPAFIVVNYMTRYLISPTPQPVGYLEQPLVNVTTTPPTSASDL